MDNVNDLVKAEWVEERTPAERVREVMRNSYEVRSTADVADTACITPEEARKHLSDLVAEGYVDKIDEGCKRNWESLVADQAADLRDRFDRDELAEAVAEMESVDEPDETTERNLKFVREALNQLSDDDEAESA